METGHPSVIAQCMDIPYGHIGRGASQNHLMTDGGNQTSGQVQTTVSTSLWSNPKQSAKPVLIALKHHPMCGIAASMIVPCGSIAWEELFLRLTGLFQTLTRTTQCQPSLIGRLSKTDAFLTPKRNHILNQQKQIDRLVESTADALGVEKSCHNHDGHCSINATCGRYSGAGDFGKKAG